MKRKFTFLIAALALLVFMTPSLAGWGQERAQYNGTFTRISSADDFVTGYYVVTASRSASSNSGYALGSTVDDNKRITGVSVSIPSTGKLVTPDNAIVYYITKTDAVCTFQNVSTGKYMYQASTTSGKGMGFRDNSANITLTAYNSSSPIGFKFTLNGNSNNLFKYNAGSKWFANYANDYTTSMAPVDLFRLFTYSLIFDNAPTGGTVTVTNGSSNVNSGSQVGEGATLNIVATPAGGYIFDGWTIIGTEASVADASSASTTFTMGTADATITANFVEDGNYINVSPTTANVAEAGGDIEFSVSTDQTLADNPVVFYTTSEGTTTTTTPDWISEIIYMDGELVVTVAVNTGVARTAYFKVESGTVQSDVITINQAAITVATPEFDEEAGTYYEDLSVDITCTTEGATIYYTTDGTTPAANNGTEYDGNGVEITETTTLKAIAIKNGVSSEVATATYTIIHPITIAAARTQATGSVTTRGVVTYVSGKNAYIQDATAAICVYGNSNWSNIIAGDDIVVSGTLDTYANGGNLLEIKNPSVTKISSGNPKPCVTKTVAEINTDNFSELQGMFVQIVKAIYDYYNDKVSQNSNEINVYGEMGDAEDGDVVTFKGNITYYNSAIQISNLQDVSIIHEPAITADASLAVPNYILSTPEASIDYEILTVNGTNLEGNITVALEEGASSDFELLVSENPDTWGNTMQLTPATGTVSDAPIAVRLKAGKSVNGYSDRIVLSSTNAATVYVDVTGSVTYAHVTYDGNGDGVTNVPTDNANYSYNQQVTVLGAGEMDKEGYEFLAWDTKSDGTGTTYEGGDQFNITSDVTLYAQWVAKSYDITKATMTNGDVIVKVGENVVTSATTGTIVTLVVTPAANYVLSGLTVAKTDDATTTVVVTNNQFTMPPYPVTVSATFVEYYAYVIDFESAMSTYTNWVYSNITAEQTTINGHGGTGTKYGKTNGTETAYIQTKDKIASPGTFVCYISKIGTNTNANSYWKVQYSSNGSTWTTQGDDQAAAVGITEGTWTKIERDLSGQSNVYIRIYYTGSTAVRAIDDISLEYTPAQEFELTVASVANIDIKATVGSTDVTESHTLDVEASKTVNLTVVSEDDNYQFDDWVVYKTGDESTTVTVTNNSFTMPEYPVTVSATTKEVRTITYSVNGTTSSTIYDKGTVVELAAPASGIPDKFTFVGWTANPANTADENLVTSYTANDNATFFAVFKKNNSITLTGDDFGSYDTSEAEVTMQGLTWGRYYVMKQGGIQFKKDNHGYFYNKTPIENLSTIIATRKSGTTNLVTIKVGNSQNPSTESALSPSSTSSLVDTYTISGNEYVHIQNLTNATPVYTSFEFRFTGDETRYTRVFQNENVTANITITGPSIIPSGSTLDMGNYTLTNNLTEPYTKLIIEDGAQVKSNNAFNGTLKKNITGYSSYTGEGNGGYYLMGTPSPVNVFGTLLNGLDNDKADVYWFNGAEQGQEWQNAKANVGGGGVAVGGNNRGFLFAYQEDCELSIPSVTAAFPATNLGKVVNLTYVSNVEAPFNGYNLIGNPFTCTAYLADGRDFYRMNAAGDGLIINTDEQGGGNAIDVCEGIFVVVTDGGSVTFQTTDPTMNSAGNNSMLNLTVSQAQNTRGEAAVIDAARIRFGESQMLPKFYFMGNNTGLYIPQNGKDYAVVNAEAQGEMPVNFKAAENGTYTITVNAENLEVNYLHLIDNLTGNNVDLLATPSYTFDSRKSDYASRFRLVFSANENQNENENFGFVDASGNLIVTNEGEATLQVIDMLGRVVDTYTVNGNASVPTQAVPGVYVLRLINGDNVKTQKIVVK